ncbi:RHS repeat domain-containing protein [Sorangium cellulosum]|uniref:RHS repeat domain-containing protein n=1 Tax=Sorangium cellulosum TaxID=56 RepID=UPI001F470141|nr:RHS repeat-associated core domain-containing protein [Sorangium cellulosum]
MSPAVGENQRASPQHPDEPRRTEYLRHIGYDEFGQRVRVVAGNGVERYVPDGARGWKQQEPIRERTYRNEYRYTGPRPHAATEVDEVVVGESSPRLRELLYDASGNQVEWKYRTNPQRRLEWDDDGRLVSVQENRQELSRALYDGAGERRVHRHGVAGEEETAYVDQHLVLRNGEYPTKHIFADDTRVASKIDADFFREPPVLYYHPDQLGSTQYITDEDQALSQHAEYLPSGELWADQTDGSVQNRQPYLFNGKELDLSTGLYHYGARSYEPRLGVWVSPDPVLTEYMVGRINGGVYRPINLGLYTYTWNNPVVMSDPTGRWPTAEDIEAGLARAGDTIAGFSYGFVLGVTPIAGNLVGFLPPPKNTDSFQIGMGAGQVAGGLVQMTAGEAVAGASARGGAAATLGSGGAAAPIAVPATVAGVGVGVVLVESGRAAVMQGAMTMQMAATGGDSSGEKELSGDAGGAPKPSDGWGNIGSHGPVPVDDALEAGTTWLGEGYKEIGPKGSGVFRSADGLRQFRMTAGDLDASGHGAKTGLGTRVHFEHLDGAGRIIENLHMPIKQ